MIDNIMQTVAGGGANGKEQSSFAKNWTGWEHIMIQLENGQRLEVKNQGIGNLTIQGQVHRFNEATEIVYLAKFPVTGLYYSQTILGIVELSGEITGTSKLVQLAAGICRETQENTITLVFNLNGKQRIIEVKTSSVVVTNNGKITVESQYGMVEDLVIGTWRHITKDNVTMC